MIVVSNTSPLTNLAAIGQFDLLSALYPEIHIACAVWDELNAEGGEGLTLTEIALSPAAP